MLTSLGLVTYLQYYSWYRCKYNVQFQVSLQPASYTISAVKKSYSYSVFTCFSRANVYITLQKQLKKASEEMAQHLLANIPCQFINYLVCKEMKNIIFEPSTNSQTNCKKDLGVQREDRRINVQQKVNQLEASMMAFSEDF